MVLFVGCAETEAAEVVSQFTISWSVFSRQVHLTAGLPTHTGQRASTMERKIAAWVVNFWSDSRMQFILAVTLVESPIHIHSSTAHRSLCLSAKLASAIPLFASQYRSSHSFRYPCNNYTMALCCVCRVIKRVKFRGIKLTLSRNHCGD